MKRSSGKRANWAIRRVARAASGLLADETFPRDMVSMLVMKTIAVVATLLALSGCAKTDSAPAAVSAAPAPAASAVPAAPAGLEIPAGTVLEVRVDQTL